MESRIRDNLALNLEIIEDGLTLIEKEFYLKPFNSNFTKGYIDILAKDVRGKFVIIEIKRSNQAARQAIHELLKYKSSVQNKYCVKSSEVRLMIVSTEWNELLIPFTKFSSKFSVEGWKIEVNKEFAIDKIRAVQPVIDTSLEKDVSDNQGIYLFRDAHERDKFSRNINVEFEKIGIEDFVTIELSNIHNEILEFRYGCYIAFLEKTIESYHKLIKKSGRFLENTDECVLNKDGYFDTKESLEGIIIALLPKSPDNSYFETSDPYKLRSLITAQNWKISDITSYGIFKNDPRSLSNEYILNKILKSDSGGGGIFLGVVDSIDIVEIDETLELIDNSFSQFELFTTKVKQIIRSIKRNHDFIRIHINIYHPEDLLTSIGHTYHYKDIRYLPICIVHLLESDYGIKTFTIGYGWKRDKNIPYKSEFPNLNSFESRFGAFDEWLYNQCNIRPVVKVIESSSDDVKSLIVSDSRYRNSPYKSVEVSDIAFTNRFVNEIGRLMNKSFFYD